MASSGGLLSLVLEFGLRVVVMSEKANRGVVQAQKLKNL
jgi:hypothetical protein